MTVSYNLDVSSVNAFSFIKLLFRWRGSIWKGVKSELLIWSIAYCFVSAVYRNLLTHPQQEIFDKIAKYCNSRLDYIPLTFMLGFFVNIVVARWREIFSNMGWIENAALTIVAMFRGRDPHVVLKRRSIIRYLVLTQILVYRDISMRVRRRFPNMESVVTAGFLHEHELQALEDIDIAYDKYWAPINWAIKIVTDATSDKLIESSSTMNYIIVEIRNFRTNLAHLCNYDWVSIPIAYPQVIFLAVRVYFFICLVSRQFLANHAEIDLYIPFMTVLQFVFFIGWMKVAEALLNPLGEDDDDFEANFLIDKNLATGMAIVDTNYDDGPALQPDVFMNKKFVPVYSADSTKDGITGLAGSAEGVELAKPKEEIKMVSVSPYCSTCDLSVAPKTPERLSTSQRLRRRFTTTFSKKQKRPSYTVQPINLGESLPANFDFKAARNGISKESLSGDMQPVGSRNLSKVEEEDSPSSSKSGSLEEADDQKIHSIFANDLYPLSRRTGSYP